MKRKNEYLESGRKESCYGCSACAGFCPSHAIVMEEDERGFWYPKLDTKLCVECGICRKACPFEMERDKAGLGRLYATEHINDEVLRSSQSGGMFTALSDDFLKTGGVVYGVVLNEKLEAVHVRADDFTKRDQMKGSKYVQSRLEESLVRQIGEDLMAGKKGIVYRDPMSVRDGSEKLREL